MIDKNMKCDTPGCSSAVRLLQGEQAAVRCAGSESHHQAKLILDQLQRLTADIDAPAYDKAVKDLKEIVLKHFADEEKYLFPAIDKCNEKADELNQKLEAFKAD
jgi:iron-sulfur cluster repair protein YtfE (RIC family)